MITFIRRAIEGDCRCPGPFSPEDPPTCHHWWECEWGRIDYGDPRPDRGQIGHLMLTVDTYVDHLLIKPVTWPHKGGRTDSASRDGDRMFVHSEWNGHSWTWELFPAKFADGRDFDGLLIGRWPD
jgi:hypothetical protein